MVKNNFFYLLLFVFAFCSCKAKKMVTTNNNSNMEVFDWQGHRGCRGLLPENTIEAFQKALSFNEIVTLELDLSVSKDNQLVVSHEPWMSDEICSHPDGSPVYLPDNFENYIAIHKLNYDEIKKFDCGSRGHPRFPNQVAMKTYKPTLNEVIQVVKKYCSTNKRKFPKFNIEIKTKPEWDSLFTPSVNDFVDLTIATIKKEFPENYSEIFTIQSFDIGALEAIWEKDNSIPIAYLVENDNDFQANMNVLSFIPKIYSPKYELVNKSLIEQCKAMNMKVIPWTVNTIEDMKKLIKLGVDGIITDYPNIIEEAIDGNK